MDRLNEVIKILPQRIKEIVDRYDKKEEITEIRLRTSKPLEISKFGISCFLDCNGRISAYEDAYKVRSNEINEIIEYASAFSRYAYEDEIKNGYITIKGGNRIGICGKTVVENGYVKTIKCISSLNIRISREIKGCGEKVLRYILDDRGGIFNTIIISPPGCGKTTLLRDLIRLISNGYQNFKGINVGVVDERCEIGACEFGIPGNDLGFRTDILDGCPKKQGIEMLIRSMTPKVIAVDEIGTEGDMGALIKGLNSGCKFLATIHAYDIEDVMRKEIINSIADKVVDRMILLSDKEGPGSIEGVYNKKGEKIDD